MENIIYTASPLQAFLGDGITTIVLGLMGVIGTLWAIFGRKEKPLARLGTGCASIILLLASMGVVISIFMTLQTGAVTVTVKLNDKRVIERKCSSNNSWRKCTYYVLETNAGQKFIDFTIPQEAFDKTQIGFCYAATYFPNKPLLGDYLPKEKYADLYESVSTITRIEKVNCP
jgi:hypothetical protein